MKLCRYNDDQLGVVLGDKVHDVTSIQNRVIAESRYAMKGDAVIAALGNRREELEAQAKKAKGLPLADVKLLAPVARPSKVMAAPVN